jgi:hypothetical protein
MRYRVVLPASMGAIAAGLIVWDLYNLSVIRSMGMARDTGAPFWPYQASFYLLSGINAPVFVLAAPFFFLPHLELVVARYPVLLPMVLIWWWWVGTRIDFGILGRRYYRWPRLSGVMVAMFGTVFFCAGAWQAIENVRWMLEYQSTMALARSIGPNLWMFVLAGGCFLGAVRLFQRRFPAVTEQRPRSPILAKGYVVVILVAVATGLLGTVPESRIDPNSCISSVFRGCIHGTIADENGKPVETIMVEVVPVDRTGDARWLACRRVWTDGDGRYSVNRLLPGEYLVAVHYYAAPHEFRPFSTAFYPGVGVEGEAEHVSIRPNSRAFLEQLRLRILPLVTIDVEVVWPDDSMTRHSSLSLQSWRYPGQVFMGGFGPLIDDGRSELTLPEGFDYLVRATVDCHHGSVVQSRESPVQRVRTNAGETPRKLRFTIPGPPCNLW